MNYGELKTYLRNLINRTDITDPLVVQFITQSKVRIERRLRLSTMSHLVDFKLDGTTGNWKLPPDYLELIDLYTDGGELERVDTSKYLRTLGSVGIPQVFVQTGAAIRMRPIPSADTSIYLNYYRSLPDLVLDEDQNLWSSAAVDCLIYGAAEVAGDYYEDERLQRYAAKFEATLAELENQQTLEDFSGPMRVQPAYSYPSEDNY
ncbi:hypothetical protein D3Y57_05540 [Sphingomonas paeninsulae]|uniref:Uncharacterized protein n=1 Tax=Sphingomonas paeninsulae TaxID=2319844 RepID=A0A494TEV1_SPHPE|nr:hypothetical protein [Sphingomonas paeninsulae]AYJ85543.1 hypothetical protein D3Y57_05540 [Sphingomonas paeninsulae]